MSEIEETSYRLDCQLEEPVTGRNYRQVSFYSADKTLSTNVTLQTRRSVVKSA
jgi:hypothetical protein